MVEMKKGELIRLLKRNPNCNQSFIHEVSNEDPLVLENLGSNVAKKASKLAGDVSREVYRIQAFTRFKLSKHGILFSKIDPQFQIEDLAIKRFWNRFPQFVIVLESKPKRGIFLYGPDFTDVIFTKSNMKDVISELELKIPINPLLEDIPEFSDVLWERYYASQYIPSRKNLKQFLKYLPRKYHKWKGLETEAQFGTRKLDEFTSIKLKKNKKENE
jgi:probable DNA metabolism protein